jgi:hypothetical protein
MHQFDFLERHPETSMALEGLGLPSVHNFFGGSKVTIEARRQACEEVRQFVWSISEWNELLEPVVEHLREYKRNFNIPTFQSEELTHFEQRAGFELSPLRTKDLEPLEDAPCLYGHVFKVTTYRAAEVTKQELYMPGAFRHYAAPDPAYIRVFLEGLRCLEDASMIDFMGTMLNFHVGFLDSMPVVDALLLQSKSLSEIGLHETEGEFNATAAKARVLLTLQLEIDDLFEMDYLGVERLSSKDMLGSLSAEAGVTLYPNLESTSLGEDPLFYRVSAETLRRRKDLVAEPHWGEKE